MSRVDENDLISKFISALTIFGERSAALEARVLSELNGMRSDIQQLKQTISAEHNTVSLPRVMEQQRITMIELINQIKPIIAASAVPPAPSSQQLHQQQPPTVAAIAPIQQPIVASHVVQQPIAPIQPQIVPPTIQQQVQPPNVAPVQPVNATFGDQFKLKEGEWYCQGCYVKNAGNINTCICCNAPRGGGSPAVQQQAAPKPVVNFKPQTFAAPTTAATGLFGTSTTSKAEPPKQQAPVSFSFNQTNIAKTPAATTPLKQEGIVPKVETPGQKATPPTNLFGTSTAPKSQQEAPKQNPVTFSFNPTQTKTTAVTPQKQENKPLFGSTSASPASTPQQGSLFGGGSGSNTSFASMAANTSGGTSFLNKSGSNAGIFGDNPKQFSFLSGTAIKAATKKADDEDGEEKGEAPEEFAPDDTQFIRPNIALPDLVEVKTGEENEEVLFNARCRLYRFLSVSEVKERGTGDMKLLKNRETGKVRCVMRREQVLKVCANFAIPPNFDVHNTKRGENVLTWTCKDYSDPEEKPDGEQMTLICRFKDVETAKKFKEVTQSVTQ